MSLSLVIKTSHFRLSRSVLRKAGQNRILHIHYTLLMKAALRQNRKNQIIFVKLNLYTYGDSETASFPV
jgi:hypothetical protein